MIKVLFICHGNICRSPMAEYVFKDILKKNDAEDGFEVASAATSREELGNDIYPPAKKILTQHGVPFGYNAAKQVTEKDIEYYDHIIAMEEYNINNMVRMFGESVRDKLRLLMDYTDRPGDVTDPYYSHDYESVYKDIEEGCRGLFAALVKGEKNESKRRKETFDLSAAGAYDRHL